MYLKRNNVLFSYKFTRIIALRAVVGSSLLLVPLIPLAPVHAQVLIPNLSNSAISLSSLTNFTYTQDFNSLPGGNNGPGVALTSLNTTALRGLQIARSGGSNNTSNIIVDNGSSTSGSVYSYGTQMGTNRRFGTLTTTTSSGDLYYGFRFVNDTSDAVLSMNVSFIGEIWRTGQTNLAETLQFSSAVFNVGDGSLGAAGYTTAGDSLQYAKQAGSTAGSEQSNLALYRETKTGTINFAAPVASGQEIWIRWKDTELASINDNGMSIDDLNVTFTPTPAPPAVLSALVGSAVGCVHFGGARWRKRRRKQQA